MKILHCADLHLDAKMTSTLDKEHAAERKAELLQTFQNMITYAKIHGIEAILIAGDMFDKKNISVSVRNIVYSAVTDNPDITFFYLSGNHDKDNFLSDMEEIPDNFKTFSDTWTAYTIGKLKNVVITGIELGRDNLGNVYNTLILDSDMINIVMLHGQESETGAKDKAQIINLRLLHNKGIDYLALGHIHAYKKERLDGRGIYCYSGCLEGRGFDECGEHGFVVLDINEDARTIQDEFIPFAKRRLYTVKADVSGCMSSIEMAEKIKIALADSDCERKDLVKIILSGALDVECEKNVEYLTAVFAQEFYFVKIYDETSMKIVETDYEKDESLKGEFVRKVLEQTNLPEKEQAALIHLGLQILNKEEVL